MCKDNLAKRAFLKLISPSSINKEYFTQKYMAQSIMIINSKKFHPTFKRPYLYSTLKWKEIEIYSKKRNKMVQ